MFVTEPTPCAENIADALKSYKVKASEVKLVAQDDVSTILFSWYSSTDDATYVGCYLLRVKTKNKQGIPRTQTMRETMATGN